MSFFNKETGYFNIWFYIIVLLIEKIIRIEYGEFQNYIKNFLRTIIFYNL